MTDHNVDYALRCFFKASKNADFMAEHIILWIILQLKASKNTDFMTEHIIQHVALLFKASKNDLKLAKC